MIREQLARSPTWEENRERLERTCVNIDREIKLLLDMRDARYVLNSDVGNYHRRNELFWCTDAFLNAFLSALVHPRSSCTFQGIANLMEDMCGDDLAYLLPESSGKVFLSIL